MAKLSGDHAKSETPPFIELSFRGSPPRKSKSQIWVLSLRFERKAT